LLVSPGGSDAIAGAEPWDGSLRIEMEQLQQRRAGADKIVQAHRMVFKFLNLFDYPGIVNIQ
jgi:hypothetical protein